MPDTTMRVGPPSVCVSTVEMVVKSDIRLLVAAAGDRRLPASMTRPAVGDATY